jgi:type VI secretion system protein VasJ
VSVTELLELGTTPIRPDAPAGGPGRDEPEFEVLQSEVRKLESPDLPTIDWDKAIAASTKLLGTKSKDLLIASYMSVGLLERDGLAGFAVGLTIVRDLISTFWETLYPDIKRLRGRVAAIEWLSERAGQSLQRKAGRRVAADAVAQCLERVAEIDEKLSPLLDSPPLLGDLRRALEQLASASAPSEPSSAPSAGAASSSSYESVSSSAPTSVETGEQLEKALDEGQRLLEMSAAYLRSSEPVNPLGYRLPRMLWWSRVADVPPNEGGVTLIPDFDPSISEQFEQAFSSGNYPAVLEQTEALFPNSPLWFDVSRCAAQALEGQGEAFTAATEGIALELAVLLKRHPDLLNLKTAGGVPLASDATRQWIAKKVLVGAGIDLGPSPSASGAGPRGGAEFAETAQQAKKLARGKKLGEALTLLEKGAQRTERLEDRVAWKLEVARTLMTAGQDEMALAQLEGLDAELRSSTIEEWDPQLCVEVLKNLLLCRRKAESSMELGPGEQARSREIMGRLCRLDVAAALELNGRR